MDSGVVVGLVALGLLLAIVVLAIGRGGGRRRRRTSDSGDVSRYAYLDNRDGDAGHDGAGHDGGADGGGAG